MSFDLTIKTRILLFPILALTTLLLVYLTAHMMATKNVALSSDIERAYFPQLELDRTLESLLTDIQRELQDAGTIEDLDLLNQADVYRDRFLETLDQARHDAHINPSDIESKERLFNEYYLLARSMTEQIIVGDTAGEMFNSRLRLMNARFHRLRDALESSTSASRDDILAAFAQSRANQNRFMTILQLVTVIGVGLFLLLSMVLARSINQPLAEVISGLGRYSRGDEEVHVTIHQNDEIGELAAAFNEMMRLINESRRKVRAENWLKGCLAELNDQLRRETGLEARADRTLSFCAKALNARGGAFYLRRENTLYLKGVYNTERDTLPERVEVGEGKLGRAALKNRLAVFDSDSGEDPLLYAPSGTLIKQVVIPLRLGSRTRGVMQLDLEAPLAEIQHRFLDHAADIIGAVLDATVAGIKMKQLLDERERQAEVLAEKQSALRRAYDDLEKQADDLKHSETQLRQQREALRLSNEQLTKRGQLLEAKQEAIQQKNLELEQSNHYKSEFMANMSHELRTPLNSILILSKMLFEKVGDFPIEKRKEYAQTIHASGRELLQLIDDVLDLAKVDAGKMEINTDFLKFSFLTRYVKRNFEPQCEQKGLTLRIETDPNLPEGMITDYQRVEQVIKNLMSNAVKFTNQGAVTFAIRRPTAEQAAGEEPKIAIAVSDTGIGIPKHKQTAIFEAFRQVDGGTSRKYGGTGLGLSISEKLSQLLGGFIHLESVEGEGATFTMILPERPGAKADPAEPLLIRADSHRPPSRAEQEEAATVSGLETPASLKGRKVLVVDDDIRHIFAVSKLLEESGLLVEVATNGEEALLLLDRDQSVEAVLMDMMMPVMDGYTALHHLRRGEATRHLPVIALTARVSEPDRQACLAAGASDYLTKPLEVDQLLTKLEHLLHIEDTQQQPDPAEAS